MPLNIIVCVKNTPASTGGLTFDPASGKIKADGASLALNPFDEYAVEEAVRLKERVPGSKAVALSAGSPAMEGALREALARGLDQAVLILSPELDAAGPLATGRALAAGIKKLSSEAPVHLAIFGKNTNEDASGLTGGLTAAWLDWPAVVSVKKIGSIDENAASLERMMEDGVDIVKTRIPAVIGTVKEINEPRLPSLKGKMAAKKAEIRKLSPQDLGLSSGDMEEALKAVSLSGVAAPPPRPQGVRVDGATAQEKARKLVDLLIERRLI